MEFKVLPSRGVWSLGARLSGASQTWDVGAGAQDWAEALGPGQAGQRRCPRGRGPSYSTATSEHRADTGAATPSLTSLCSPEAMQPPQHGTGQVASQPLPEL